jgi:dTDP-4-amino-4,6-dideoxygalactose transaminase
MLLGGGLDVALMSFAENKIIPGEGGALLFSAAHADMRDAVLATIDQGKSLASPRLAISLRNLVHALADCWREVGILPTPSIFTSMLPAYQAMIATAGSIEHEALVLKGLASLNENRTARYRNYLAYFVGIDKRKATVMGLHAGSTCWRCSVVFPTPKVADAATRALRKAGLPASNHYFPLSILVGDNGCPNAEKYSRRVVNLWVDQNVTPSGLAQTIEIINRT